MKRKEKKEARLKKSCRAPLYGAYVVVIPAPARFPRRSVRHAIVYTYAAADHSIVLNEVRAHVPLG